MTRHTTGMYVEAGAAEYNKFPGYGLRFRNFPHNISRKVPNG